MNLLYSIGMIVLIIIMRQSVVYLLFLSAPIGLLILDGSESSRMMIEFEDILFPFFILGVVVFFRGLEIAFKSLLKKY